MKKFLSVLALITLVPSAAVASKKKESNKPNAKPQSAKEKEKPQSGKPKQSSGWCGACNKPNSACGR